MYGHSHSHCRGSLSFLWFMLQFCKCGFTLVGSYTSLSLSLTPLQWGGKRSPCHFKTSTASWTARLNMTMHKFSALDWLDLSDSNHKIYSQTKFNQIRFFWFLVFNSRQCLSFQERLLWYLQSWLSWAALAPWGNFFALNPALKLDYH